MFRCFLFQTKKKNENLIKWAKQLYPTVRSSFDFIPSIQTKKDQLIQPRFLSLSYISSNQTQPSNRGKTLYDIKTIKI